MIFIIGMFILVWVGAAFVDSDRERPFLDGFFTALWVTPLLFLFGWIFNN